MKVPAFTVLSSVVCSFFVSVCLALPGQAQTPPHGGTLLKFNFDDLKGWPQKAALPAPSGQTESVIAAEVGTVDEADGTQSSGGLLFTANNARGVRNASFVSGKLPLRCRETDAPKLTLSFTLNASSTRPVTVRVESFNQAGKRTGGLQTQIFPAAPNFYERFAVDLLKAASFGTGRFRPSDPYVQFTFGVMTPASDNTPAEHDARYQMRLDNVNYASPAYYVSPGGSDSHDGRTEETAFATPQKALDVAGPGDIVLLREGTYRAGQASVASFPRPGSPDAWIVLKNYPGEHPTLTSTGWNIVSIAKGYAGHFSTDPALAYLEVRGLHVRGEGDVARQKYPEAMDKADPRTNSNGIAVDCRYSLGVYHDIRIADNLVEYCPACGIGTDADWVTVEGNVCRSNSWTTIYATSGISVAGHNNFDAVDNVYKRLIRNNVCCHNQTYEKWADLNRYSDGNGIILDVNRGHDVNQGKDAHPPSNYVGRTLVQSNLSFDNGGSGIHAVTCDRIDIVNNTVYLNSASPHLEYSEIFTYACEDVHIVNNVMVAPIANVAAGEKPEPVNLCSGGNKNVVFAHNLYYGGNVAPTLGDGDVIGDPKFVSPSRDHKAADFHLLRDSPAIGKGKTFLFSPFLDLDGKRRRGGTPTEGAYEK